MEAREKEFSIRRGKIKAVYMSESMMTNGALKKSHYPLLFQRNKK